MSVTQRHRALGAWDVRLRDDTPPSILDAFDKFGHIAVTEAPMSRLDDTLLDAASYVGVLTTDQASERHTIAGRGLSWWLGQEDDKGPVFEDPTDFVDETFANTIRALLPAAVAEGTLHSVAGSYSGSHRWQTARHAIDYVCDVFGAHWIVYPHSVDGVRLDAGEATDLFGNQPTAVVAPGLEGRDPDGTVGLEGRVESEVDANLYSTRVVILGEGVGEDQIEVGSAELATVPYSDLRGNAVAITRLISEAETSEGNVESRAQLHLNRFARLRESIALHVDDVDHLDGELVVGADVWAYDPDQGLVDPNTLLTFRGRRIHPVRIRLNAVTWPIRRGMGVYFRHHDGTWIDITGYVEVESGGVEVEVGDPHRSLRDRPEDVGPRLPEPPEGDPGLTPDPPVLLDPFTTGSYLDREGRTRAFVVVEWDWPILNDDGSTVTDGDRIEVAFREKGGDASWASWAAGWGETTLNLLNLDSGVVYEIRARSWNSWGRSSAWTATVEQTAEEDTIAPSQPAPPTVAGNPLHLQIKHELGVAAGGTFNLEADLDHLEVHVGTTDTFTPTADTHEGDIDANAGHLDAQTPVVKTFDVPADGEDPDSQRWVRVVAVDHAGNRSDASESASVTAQLIDSQFISELTATKIAAGNLTVAVELAVGGVLHAGDPPGEVDPTGVYLDAGGIEMLKAGVSMVLLDASTGDATFAGDIEASDITGSDITGTSFKTAETGARLEITQSEKDRISFYNGAGTAVGFMGYDSSASVLAVRTEGFAAIDVEVRAEENLLLDAKGTTTIAGGGLGGGPNVQILDGGFNEIAVFGGSAWMTGPEGDPVGRVIHQSAGPTNANGDLITIPVPDDVEQFLILLGGLSTSSGLHEVFMRFRDSSGNFSSWDGMRRRTSASGATSIVNRTGTSGSVEAARMGRFGGYFKIAVTGLRMGASRKGFTCHGGAMGGSGSHELFESFGRWRSSADVAHVDLRIGDTWSSNTRCTVIGW